MKKGIITICARGESKGVPGKNIKIIGGKPLIYFSMKIAEKLKETLDVDIFLSTDSLDIKENVKAFGILNIKT